VPAVDGSRNPQSQIPKFPNQSTTNNQQSAMSLGSVRGPDGFFVAIFSIHALGVALHLVESIATLLVDQLPLNT
jgi:hypothetical protein